MAKPRPMTLKDLSSMIKPPPVGWRCPACGRGVSPTVTTCDHGGPMYKFLRVYPLLFAVPLPTLPPVVAPSSAPPSSLPESKTPLEAFSELLGETGQALAYSVGKFSIYP